MPFQRVAGDGARQCDSGRLQAVRVVDASGCQLPMSVLVGVWCKRSARLGVSVPVGLRSEV